MPMLVDLASTLKLLRGKRVLLLEDSDFLGEIFGDALREAGCEVLGPYQRVDEAMAALRESKCDAAVMDVCVHGDRSLDLAESLGNQNVPVLLVSGYGADTVPAKFREDFMQKPFDETQLLSALYHTISRRAPNKMPCVMSA